MFLFFELLQVAVGTKDRLSEVPTDKKWSLLYATAQKQALLGVCFSGIERLPSEQRPPKMLLLQWCAVVNKIEHENEQLDASCVKVNEGFKRSGFRSCILKGQGLARFYPLPRRRQSGDIDVWLEGSRDEILSYILSVVPNAEVRFHHVDFPVFKDAEVEVHFQPSYMFNPCTYAKMSAWIRDNEKQQFEHAIELAGKTIAVPTLEFNMVYVLLHIYRHLFEEGIGMRQLMDYYYLLCSDEWTHMDPVVKERVCHVLRSLGMMKFASAVMYVLATVFGLHREQMFVCPDEKEGTFLLQEIMLSGNFGQYDDRMQHGKNESPWQIFVRKQTRSIRFLKSYPSEIMWSPLFNVYQRIWRWKRGFVSIT